MENIENEFIEFFQKNMSSMGVDASSARMVAILYIEPGPVSMDEIVGNTGYSRATVSNSMRFMENLGLVARVKKPGSKKAFFYMEKDIFKLNKLKMAAARENYIKPMKAKLPGMIEKYRGMELDETSHEKLDIIERYYMQVSAIEVLLDHVEKEIDRISRSIGTYKQKNNIN